MTRQDPALRGEVRRRPFASWLAFSVLGLVCMLCGLLYLQWRQSQDLEATSRLRADSVTALAFQFEREFLRLRHAVDGAVKRPDLLDADELTLRYDIFRSRQNLLLDNPSVTLLRDRAEYLSTLPKLNQLAALGDSVFGQTPPQAKGLGQLLAQMEALGPDIQALSLAANSVMANLVETKQNTIVRQGMTITRLMVAMILLLAVIAVLLWLRMRRDSRERAALESLTQELRDAQLRAEAANQGKTRFLANMSHELRTPFNGVMGMLTLLESTPLTQEQTDHVQTAKNSAQHLLTLLNDILDISAMEAGKLSIQPEPVNLPALLDQVANLMRGAAKAKSLAFHLDVPDDLPTWVKADPTRLKQILFNVIGNGIKFTQAGTVSLSVERAGPQGLVAPLRFVVRDTGIGMDAAAVGRLFQRFYQAESHTARRFGGTGLGLEISRNLARLMEGDLTAQSAPGQGSTFTLELPLPLCPAPSPSPNLPPTDTATVPPPAPGAQVQSLAGRRVLVAEDHPVNQKLMAALLNKLGCVVTFCENGALAVDALSNQPFDLVLMDIHMPVMDGLTATRTIRALSTPAANVPIIALTADVMNNAEQNAFEAGVNAFLAKPIRLTELEAQMSALLT